MIRIDKGTISNLKAVGLNGAQIAWVMDVCKRTIQRWMLEPVSRGRPAKILPLQARWVLSQLRLILISLRMTLSTSSSQISTLRYIGQQFLVICDANLRQKKFPIRQI